MPPTSSTASPFATPAFALPVANTDTGSSSDDPRTLSVLHLVNGEHFSGAERVQSHLGRRLPENHVAADFACLKPGLFVDHLERAAADGQPIGRGYRIPMRGRFDLRVAFPIHELVQQHGYRLLHAHTPRTAMVAAMVSRFSKVPWVYHVHSPAAHDSNRPLQNRLNAWIETASLHGCRQLITVSDSLRRTMIDAGWSSERVATIHNGVPCQRPSRHSIPQPHGRWTLGMVALMRPRKGLEVLLRAVRELAAAGHDVHLRCIGPFESEAYGKTIAKQVTELQLDNRVEFTGFADDIPTALSQLDALVLPSLYGEGLPMVVLEAMAAALPVVATEVEGTPEAIRDGQDGLLAKPGCSHSLAATIERLVSGQVDWQAMAESACQRHHDHFSDRAMAAATAAIYFRLVASGP